MKPETRTITAREDILGRLASGLAQPHRAPASPLPDAMRVAPRAAGETSAEITLLLATIESLGGHTQRVGNRAQLETALSALVESEKVRRGVLWSTLGSEVEGILQQLGVEIVSPHADKRSLAACDLGVTGVDAALAQTGTLVLRSSSEQPGLVSLLPRVHLAIFRPAVLCPDLSQLFATVKYDKHLVLVSGPSRTADIEKTLALGVHGPKELYVWCYEAT